MHPDRNLLGGESSPYLLQHAHNPVHWRPWGAAALAEAKARDCPILISIGYAACHWCHVMAHESFENERIAAEMNRLFVNVKVDREERPDIDYIYMSALHAMGQQGGWPLTMFLTPDGAPMYGGTYWPPDAALGPAFVSAGLARRRRRLARQAAPKMRRERRRRWSPISPRPTRRARATDLRPERSRPRRRGAAARGSIPSTAASAARRNSPTRRSFASSGTSAFAATTRASRKAVRGLIDALCSGGIYDHLGGGFARYSTDAQWHRAAFREDALRQRADSRASRFRPFRNAQYSLCHAGARDLRLADARNAGRRGLRGVSRTPTRTARKGGSTSGAPTRSTLPSATRRRRSRRPMT